MCSLLDKSERSAGDFIDGTDHPSQPAVPTGLSTDSESHIVFTEFNNHLTLVGDF